MKKIVYILILCAFTIDAQASKSRYDVLSRSFHLIDSQSVFERPIDLIYLSDSVTYELGATNAASNRDNAEALVVYRGDDREYFAASFGHQDTGVYNSRNMMKSISSVNLDVAQNPIHLFYAVEDSVTSYSIGAFFSQKNDNQNSLSESSTGVSVGAEIGQFQLNAVYVPVNVVKTTGSKDFDGSHYLKSEISYLSDQTIFMFRYTNYISKLTTNTAFSSTTNEQHRYSEVVLGLVDYDTRYETHFFWGAQVVSTRILCQRNISADCSKSLTRTTLPVWWGVEIEENDWLVFRGSVRQSFLFNITKDELGYSSDVVEGGTGAISDSPSGPTDTVVSAGVGLKFKNIKIDGSLSAGTSQKVQSNSLLTQTSLTYNF